MTFNVKDANQYVRRKYRKGWEVKGLQARDVAMRRFGKRVVAVLLLVIVGSWSTIHFRSDRLPTCEGKPESFWLEQFSSYGGDHMAAEKAFRAMGTNAVPFLISELRVRDARMTTWWRSLISKQRFVKVHYAPDYERWRRAIRACSALGSVAADAADALAEHLQQANPDNNLCTALGSIGVDGILPLAEAVFHQNPDVQKAASFSLQFHSAHLSTEATFEFLTNAISHSHSAVRSRAAIAFGIIGEDEYEGLLDRPVPWLLQHIDDNDADVRGWTAWALSCFSKDSNAVYGIKRALNDPDSTVRETATNALARWGSPREGR